jgi:hypothetical protein
MRLLTSTPTGAEPASKHDILQMSVAARNFNCASDPKFFQKCADVGLQSLMIAFSCRGFAEAMNAAEVAMRVLISWSSRYQKASESDIV